MNSFEYFGPTTREEAIQLLVEYGTDVKPLAGGTDLIVEYLHDVELPGNIVGITDIDDMAFIKEQGDELRIGATTILHDLDVSEAVRKHCEMLAESATLVGSRQIRNLATVGGNICNAVPSADTAPPLLAADAEALLEGPDGQRQVLLAEFFVDVRETVLQPDELLVELIIPTPPPHTGTVYRRHTPRKALDLAMVGVAASVTVDPDGAIEGARLALGAVAPVIYRVSDAEQVLVGQKLGDELLDEVAELAVKSASPISDVRGSAGYRQDMIRVLTRHCVTEAVRLAQNGSSGEG